MLELRVFISCLAVFVAMLAVFAGVWLLSELVSVGSAGDTGVGSGSYNPA